MEERHAVRTACISRDHSTSSHKLPQGFVAYGRVEARWFREKRADGTVRREYNSGGVNTASVAPPSLACLSIFLVDCSTIELGLGLDKAGVWSL